MISAYVNSWQEAIIALVVLLWIGFIFCGTLIGLWLCKENNEWGILIASLALPIIGTIAAIGIMQVEYKTVDKWIKKIKKKNTKSRKKKGRKSH